MALPKHMHEVFDYIVVGGGSAGSAVAFRLSENGRHSVLLLEAGPRDSNPWIHIPLGFGKTFFDRDVNWCLSSEPSPELGGRSIYTPCGKVLGGSSSINGLVYARGHREDYDSWLREGNSGWGYEDVLPFFRMSEDQQHGGSYYHGSCGPLSVSDVMDCHPLGKAFIESANAAGHPSNADFNGATQEGVGAFQVTARRGKRVSSAVAFLRKAHRRSNLSLKTHAEVDQLLMENRRVTGVIYAVRGVPFTATARRCVVLSAGAMNTPVILHRSGIGPKAWLDQAGIELRHELKGVGANLQDHPQARLVIRSRQPTLNTQIRRPWDVLKMGLQYALLRRGPLASSGGQTGGFLRTRPGLERPDFMYFFMPFTSADLRKGLDTFPGFTIASVLLQPRSRGTVRARSGNPKDAPVIQPNYLQAEDDQVAMLAGLRTARQIASMDPLRRQIEQEERPGAAVTSDEDLLAYVRATMTSGFHHCGTCKMGLGDDAVVDAKLRVRGLDGLVIADASVMPSIVSSGTNPAAIMIGERAADFLLAAG